VVEERLHVAALADALNRALGAEVRSSGSLLYVLWCYASDYHDDERLKGFFEDRAKEEAAAVLAHLQPLRDA
jgi:hypothetical protein